MYGPAKIAERYSDAGAAKTKLPIGKMFVLAIFAGMFIAFGAFGSQVVAADAGIGPSFGKFLGALVFPVGLLLVLMAGAELFTGNCLIIISVLDKKATVKGMLKNWAVVYAGNFVGSLFVALMLTYSHAYSLFDGKLAQSVVSTAQGKVLLAMPDAFLRGILCNILVCLAVWISFSAEDVAGKILGLYLPIMLFVLSGYEHCVANMYFIPAGIFASQEYGIAADPALNWYGCIVNNLIPVTIGNVIGGVCVIGLGYYFAYLHRTAEERKASQEQALKKKPAQAPRAIAQKPQPQPQLVDGKQIVDFSTYQDVVSLDVLPAADHGVPAPYAALQQEYPPHPIELVMNGETIRVRNDADPALLAQAVRLMRELS